MGYCASFSDFFCTCFLFLIFFLRGHLVFFWSTQYNLNFDNESSGCSLLCSSLDWKPWNFKNVVTQSCGITFSIFPKLSVPLVWKWAFITAQKMKFSIKDFSRKYDQTRSFVQIWSHFTKKSLMKNFIFCALFIFNKEARLFS